ncbi:DNA-binding NarL/FixJ family response regulator [Collimonas sp. PA-H2]|uniref:response regulator n=1 Tax=Collimonas sp. PA-H2 TaxID=1881062 RepID=UPI000BF531B7|nr:response regulator transcription factor [Collimonas sp. PA-H2]PFH08582.1 DNA-binding NarL/FixJ family response regulator [Collimonas sp. PA-H2]
MTYRILIVEDHNLLRHGLRSMITALPSYEVVGEAREGKEAIREALSLHPDMILMDLSLPGMNGIEATAQIKRRMPDIRVLVLTVYKTDEYVTEALRVGADGYVLKDASYDEFVIAIQTVISGKKYICPDVSMHLINDFLHRCDTPKAVTPWNKLTARERSILKLVAEGRTNRMTGEFLNISAKTVEKHRANLMHKLGLHNSAELILMALDMGLIEHVSHSSHGINGAAGGPALSSDISSKKKPDSTATPPE